MEGLWILILVGWLILNIVIASGFKTVAEMKNHNGMIHFWWCFFFGIAGWLLVIALPDRSNLSNTETDELPEL